MKLTSLEIKNYRNLNGIKFLFDPVANFLVGETNLGKSNFLALLNTIFNRTSFAETDFTNPHVPIEILLKISLDDIELGLFEDLFDPGDSNTINIKAVQETIDDYIQFFHQESEVNIPANTVKCLNYIYYDSLRNPANELTFDKRKGVGRFLNHILSRFLEIEGIEDIDFIDSGRLTKLLEFMNDILKNVKPFREFSIKASLEQDSQNVLARLVTLKDEKNFDLESSGYGVQFLSLICLIVFEKLLAVSKYKREKRVFEDNNGKKYISLLLGLDEPEIHLHPYMQRSLIRYLINIITNKDSDFLKIIADTFSIDYFLGQIIISTHSPSILLSDYKQIIRFYRDGQDKIVVKNGQEVSLEQGVEKHLLKNMPYVKEAFFSKCVILVEGDAELGSFPVFAQKLEVDLDDYGISVIQAGSADSIPPLMKMLEQFGVNAVALMDQDKYREEYKERANLFFTDKQDFEEEIVSACFEEKEEDILKCIINNGDTKGLHRQINQNKLNGIITKYGVPLAHVDKDYDFMTNDRDLLYPLFLSWLDINKSIILGRIIGESLPKKIIPAKFKDVIEAAKAVSQNV